MKSVQEIQQEHGRKAGEIMNSYMDTIEEIRETQSPEDGAYLDRLAGQQRMTLLREQKTVRAEKATNQAREDYVAEMERHQEELSSRVEYLKGRLFGVADAGALSRAALATDAELGTLLEIATHAGNAELGRAAFVAAEQRGLGDLMASYFARVDGEARELYQEWAEVPPPEILTRQRESVETLIPDPDPDRLMPPARATT